MVLHTIQKNATRKLSVRVNVVWHPSNGNAYLLSEDATDIPSVRSNRSAVHASCEALTEPNPSRPSPVSRTRTLPSPSSDIGRQGMERRPMNTTGHGDFVVGDRGYTLASPFTPALAL